ncbi:HEXXH motif domain-containing protein [Phytohabitans aurantiacus]|uniref:HEXXH motif domain-containing protein n=1 Tax=Phytohabitans aurantiacus TaxID=3016789 RepID=A0ABQ5R3K6_9ACTN|nr:HEXXH motif domain-containing protein [Phytohabitans aurantiacus]GLI00171.1 HEXXH motif domain-containing protein [Phytohabitans aurantiacus]
MSENLRTPLRHSVPWADFDAFAHGDGDGSGAELLSRTELSWRKLGLAALLRALATVPDPVGPLDPVDAAWRLLARVERYAPDVVARLLLHPPAGIWVSHTLRRARGSAGGDGPLWLDVGYLHALAAVAAIRAGVDFDIRIPVRAGAAVLPGLGYATVAPDSEYAEVRGDGNTVVVAAQASRVTVPRSGEASEGWQSPHELTAAAGESRLTIVLDDADPYRDMRQPKPPQPLRGSDVARWRRVLDDAWRLVAETQPERAVGLARVLTSITPLPAAERLRPLSASCDEAFGGIVASEPDDALQLAATLIHEYQHVKLGALLHLVRLHQGDRSRHLYAAWRDDPRPLGGVLQGCYAFVGITSFWRARRARAGPDVDRWLADFEFALWRRQLIRVLDQVSREPSLTELGRSFTGHLVRAVGSWRDDPVPAAVQSQTDAAADDHYGQWRAYHVRPSPDRVVALAEAWVSGAPAGDVDGCREETIHFDPSVRSLDARAVLMRLRVLDPGLFDALCKDPGDAGTFVAGAVAADVAYVRGDLPAARQGYVRLLAIDPGDPHAWLGLGLTMSASGDSVGGAIIRAPEVVRSLALAIARSGQSTDPVDLTEWLRRAC